MKKAFALAFSMVIMTTVAGSAFADNKLDQTSFGALSPNTAILSNNDLLATTKRMSATINPGPRTAISQLTIPSTKISA
jgi:hypothetical protein